MTENFHIVPKTLKVEYQVAEKSTIIDPSTADHLELLAPRGQKKSKVTLFGLLNQCSSQGGVRLLRSDLCQPSRDMEMINNRLELLDEMVSDITCYNNIRSIISRMPELDSILRQVTSVNGHIKNSENGSWFGRQEKISCIIKSICVSASASRCQKMIAP